MILPMMGFFFALVGLGGVAALATIIDNRSAHRAPLPFAVFFAGVAAIAAFFVIDGLLLGPTLGLLGGGVFGYWLGLQRRKRGSIDDA